MEKKEFEKMLVPDSPVGNSRTRRILLTNGGIYNFPSGTVYTVASDGVILGWNKDMYRQDAWRSFLAKSQSFGVLTIPYSAILDVIE